MGRYIDPPKDYQEWEQSIPDAVRQGPLWGYVAYPKALFLYDLAWFDCEHLLKDKRGKAIAEQLIRSAGSICANIEEGYGRGFGKDYARFLSFALGSARETQGWYVRARHILPPEVVSHRLACLDEIIAYLVKTIQYHRK